MTRMTRDTAKYHLKKWGRIIYAGRTRRTLETRLREHQLERDDDFIAIEQVGRRTTWAAAGIWEREQAAKGIPTGG